MLYSFQLKSNLLYFFQKINSHYLKESLFGQQAESFSLYQTKLLRERECSTKKECDVI